MKLCPQCEFIYEDDQRFCDMDGQELVHDPSPRVFAENAPVPAAGLQNDHAANTVTKIHIPIPDPPASPVAPAAAGVPVSRSSGWQPRSLLFAALAGLALVALLFAVYYARTRQSQTRKANRSSGQSASQSESRSNPQPATQSANTQPAETGSAAESATTLGDSVPAEQTLEQPPADQSSEAAPSAGLTPLTSQPPPALMTASEKSAARVRQSAALVAARASSETTRAPVIIRLTNGASIKADEAWEKRDGVWYRQAGMVTFLKRSRVRSIQRPTSPARGQTETKAETSIAQNQPRVGKAQAVNAKKDSKVTSFLKTTGRILKKPFKL